jgi:hypothetical protein
MIKIHNLQNKTEAHKTYNHIYSDKKRSQKNMKECDNRNSHISSKISTIYISFNNDRHPVIKTFTTLDPTSLHSASLHSSTLHFLSFKLHPATHNFTSSHLNFTQLHFTSLLPIWTLPNYTLLHFFPFKLYPSTFHFTSSHLNFTQLHFTSLLPI